MGRPCGASPARVSSEPGVRSRLRRATDALRDQLQRIGTVPEQLESTLAGLQDWAQAVKAQRERP